MTRPTVWVFFLCLVAFLINGRPHPEVDCVAAPYMAWSLVRQGSYDLCEYPELQPYVGGPIRELPDGAWVSMRTPGSALVAVPFVAPFALFREQPLLARDMHQLGKLAAAISVALAAVYFFLVCQRLAPFAAWPATILFALGTCLFSVASQALWMHGPAVLWLSCALYYLTRPDSDQMGIGFIAGFALGLAVLTRPTTAFFALGAWGVLAAQRRWQGVLGLTLGGVIPAILMFHYNWTHFGHLFLGGYENDNWVESPPLWLGLSGLLIAPSRGLLVYSPALILALPGLWVLWRSREDRLTAVRAMLLVWLVAAGLTLWFFARWHDWRGGWCYGPRFLCETMPIVCLLFAFTYEAIRASWQRWFAVGLVALSVAVHAVGIFGYSGYEDWQKRHALPDQGRCLFALQDTQIEAHARAVIAKLTRTRKGH